MSMETDRIEADVNESRHRLNDTLAALGDKLSPGQMLDEVMGLAQGQAGDFAKKLGTQVKDNPLPALLIAAGVGLLLMNRSGSGQTGQSLSDDDWHAERRHRALEEARWSVSRIAGETEAAFEERIHQAQAAALGLKQKAGEAVHEFKARVGQTVESAREAAEGVRQRASQMLSGAKRAVAHQAENLGQRASDARHKAENFYDETPLAAGAIAVAVGALIGASTPLSRTERDTLGGVADKAARAGADLAERGARKVEEAVERAVH
jgi:ElaB/YqjD/DUF883 family membrane-anchored ribosome-binding protein